MRDVIRELFKEELNSVRLLSTAGLHFVAPTHIGLIVQLSELCKRIDERFGYLPVPDDRRFAVMLSDAAEAHAVHEAQLLVNEALRRQAGSRRTQWFEHEASELMERLEEHRQWLGHDLRPAIELLEAHIAVADPRHTQPLCRGVSPGTT